MALVNPCGGLEWTVHPDGTIEVDGQGVITFDEGPYRKTLLACWENWSEEILEASARYRVPVAHIVALMNIETGFWAPKGREAQGAMHNYCCFGPMAVMAPNPECPNCDHVGGAFGFSAEQITTDPVASIMAGVALMARLAGTGLDLPAIAAKYNSGSLCCPGSPTENSPGKRVLNPYLLCSASVDGMSYPEWAIRGSNTALLLGLGTGPRVGESSMLLGGALLALGAGAAWWLWRR
jgi:hypothetical protein